MPHDRNGQPVKVGDVVLMRFRVRDVSVAETDCNVSLEAIGGAAYRPHVSCNAGLTEVVITSVGDQEIIVGPRKSAPVTDPANPSGDDESPCFQPAATGG